MTTCTSSEWTLQDNVHVNILLRNAPDVRELVTPKHTVLQGQDLRGRAHVKGNAAWL
jgi:hypothetical protein